MCDQVEHWKRRSEEWMRAADTEASRWALEVKKLRVKVKCLERINEMQAANLRRCIAWADR